MKKWTLIAMLVMCFGSVGHAEQIIAFKLPVNASKGDFRIAGVPISEATVYGCPSVVRPLVAGTAKQQSLFFDLSCEVLLLRPDEALLAVKIVEPRLIPQKLRLRDCTVPVVYLSSRDFVDVYASFQNRGAQSDTLVGFGSPPSLPPIATVDRENDPPNNGQRGAQTDACELTGGICLNDGEASFSVGCANFGSIEFSTSGDVALTIGGKPVSITVGSPN